jgi:16S rRNA (adenine1518-N6/adenine1519-N6)-dimethyltransferase
MIQKEVAQRINSKKGTKTYGILSVVLNYIGKSKILFDVSPHCFYPKPKVTSSVIELTFDKEVNDLDFKEFVGLVKACFGQRRKVLKNSLSTYLSNFNINSSEVNSELLERYFAKRAEELEVKDFVLMMNEIRRIKEQLKIGDEE